MSKKIQSVLKETDQSLQAVLNKAKGLKEIEQLVKAALPADIGAHIVVGQYTGTSLSLISDSAAWATKCRFMMPQLMIELKKTQWLSTLQDCKVKVGFMEKGIELTEAQVIQKPATPPGEKVKAQFAKMAENQSDCPRLQKILEKLGK